MRTALLNALPAHIAVVDSQGAIVFVNDVPRARDPRDVLQGSSFLAGRNYLEACEAAVGAGAADAHEAAAGMRRVLRRELQEFVMDYPCRTPSKPLWFRLSITPLEEYSHGGAVIMHMDVSEQKQAEIRLRRSEANLAASQRIAHLGSWELDLINVENLSGGALRWSSEVFRIWGYEPGAIEVTYENFLAAVHPDDRSLIGHAVSAALREARPYDLTHRIMRPDGTERIVREQAEFLFEEATGRPMRMIGTVLDVTEQHRAAKALERALERLNEAQRIGQIGDWEWDIATEAIVWSPQVYEIFGRDPGLGPPKNYADQLRLYDAPSQTIMQEKVALAVASGEQQDYELVSVQPGGKRVYLHAVAVTRKNPQGEVTSLYGTLQDVTDRKKLEQQFLRAQRLESIGFLAGGIAHDLNNALSPIILSLELMKDQFPDPASQEILETVHLSALRGARMVDQVLSFARGVEGQRVEVRVDGILRDIEKIVNDTFFKHIRVRTEIQDSLWPVRGDSTQLQQVILNLCVNARDAMPVGGSLTLSAENIWVDAQHANRNIDAKPGHHVLLQVEDSGTGIPADFIDKIFDPFFTTKDIGKGTGLGLCTSLAIVKSHGGFLEVYSEFGKGTKFMIYLPAQVEATVRETMVTVAGLPRGNGETILVVDDEAAVGQITKRMLEAFVYQVLLAGGGEEAQTIFDHHHATISAALTDMMMPGMNGTATIRALRKVNAALPIIVASGILDGGNTADLADVGVHHFLPKPYTANSLLTMLKTVLSSDR